MKTKTNKKENSLQELRDIRDRIGVEIQDLKYEELKKYIEEKAILHPKSVWQ